jgi:nitroimidazol reductase NimA-like FMN-containing flavoprotein (pyridoxamine 5'-phosphate oxidase superfamily)
MVIKELGEQECAAVLRASHFGHLACAKDNRPYVVPITFAFADNQIYSFSALGQKVEWMRKNPQVCLQVDDFGKDSAWKSVVVQGLFEELPDRIGSKLQREHAWSVLSKEANWWEPGGLKPITVAGASEHVFYRIGIDGMTATGSPDHHEDLVEPSAAPASNRCRMSAATCSGAPTATR